MSTLKNFAVSVKNRLRNVAKKESKSFQLILTRYFQERLLYRLSKSRCKDVFCLKGAAFLYALFQEKSRMTKDIDLLGRNTAATIPNLVTIFSEIANISFLEDGVIFDVSNIRASEIVKDGKYQGIRLTIDGYLEKTTQKLQIDIGFGDIITPQPIEMDYPVLLDLPSPKLLSYNVETVIAEKFQAMIDLSEINTRMKDFYDVFMLLENGAYQISKLENAINNTLKARNTILSKHHFIFTESFFQDKNRLKLWETWLRKMNLDPNLKFEKVMRSITQQLSPIYYKIASKQT